MLAEFPAVALIYMLGASIGSFLNVVILRYGSHQGFSQGRSQCPHCATPLKQSDLIPIVSFTFLRGTCRSCRKSISTQYPIVEAGMGIVTLALFWPLPQTLSEMTVQLLTWISVSLLVVLLTIDVQTMVLPDTYVVYLAVSVFLKTWIEGSASSDAAAGALVGSGFLLMLWIVTFGKGIGFGDVKLMIPIGFLLGLSGIVATLFIAFISGGLVATILLLRKKAHLKTAVPFGPYLIAATLLIIFFPQLPEAILSYLL